MSAWAKMVTRRSTLTLCVQLGALVAAVASSRAGSDVTLIMVEEPGCPYCAKWNREVATAYANSPEGRFAPLVRRPRGHPDLAHIKGLNYSPTFIVVRDQQEIGRITGYPGAEFFWALVDEILVKAGFEMPSAPTTR